MEDVKIELQRFLGETGVKQAAVSRAIGYDKSGGALSQWLSGKYPGDNERIADAVRGFLRREKAKTLKPKQEISFVMTSTALDAFDVAETCQIGGEIGVLIGRAGVGKTFFAKEYTRQNTGVILIEADLSYTTRDVFMELHRKCGGNGAPSLSKLKDDVIERLRGSGRLVIVDEAEFLPVRAIDLLRRVHDKAGVGILFVGLPRLFEGLISKHNDYAYILSRIGVKGVMGSLGLDDVSMIVSQGGVTDPDVCGAFLDECGGNARKLKMIFHKCVKSKEYDPERPITPELIRQKAQRLLI